MKLTERNVRVHVVGTGRTGWFRTVNPAAYVLVHEGDLAVFVRNTKLLQELLKAHPELADEVRQSPD